MMNDTLTNEKKNERAEKRYNSLHACLHAHEIRMQLETPRRQTFACRVYMHFYKTFRKAKLEVEKVMRTIKTI